MMLVHENLEFSIFQTASKPSTNESIPEQIVVALQVSYRTESIYKPGSASGSPADRILQ